MLELTFFVHFLFSSDLWPWYSFKMASKRMKKAQAALPNSMTPKDPMTKEQKKVTDWLRRNVPTKKTKFLHAHVVEYFIGKYLPSI